LVVGLIAVGVLFIAAQVYVFGIDNLWYAMKYADPKNVSSSIDQGGRKQAAVNSLCLPCHVQSLF
jgi:hypothetical protein